MGNKSNKSEQSIADLVDKKEPEEVAETPHRCDNCNRLLFKGEIGEGGIVQVKCGKCGTVNTFKINMISENFQDRIYKNRQYRYGK